MRISKSGEMLLGIADDENRRNSRPKGINTYM